MREATTEALPGNRMFVLTVLVYPLLLALLCAGAGLLVDRVAGGATPGALLPLTGLALLIALSQTTVQIVPLATATPYLLLAVGVIGLALGRRRAAQLARRTRRGDAAGVALTSILAYLAAIAPVLAYGRPSFSSYMVLTDSAAHIVGSGYLISHGASFAHLDLHNSYGEIINSYFNSAYPSGADTLFGGSAALLSLPLIWAFQPFNAFLLACAAAPAWVIARRLGLRGLWTPMAALTATLPALVYAYELIASVKEIATLPLLLALGALICTHREWMTDGARRVVPISVIAAAAISAIGIGIGPWLVASALVLAVATVSAEHARSGAAIRRTAARAGLACVVLAACAWPTFAKLPEALSIATSIAKTSDPGNLLVPLLARQAFGQWLSDSYLIVPKGAELSATDALVGLTGIAAILGFLHLLRSRRFALAGWLAAMVVLWLILRLYATTWVNAKGLVLTSPVIILLAWAGVAGLRRLHLTPVAVLLALGLAGGIAVSDAMQYHGSELAPTARYEELASIEKRFAGRGPALFTDFDEYAIYVLRRLDIGGPDFLYPPAALLSGTKGHGDEVFTDEMHPSALASYPLIITRVDPSEARPPAAYHLLWKGAYYEVWGRRAGAPTALEVVHLGGGHAVGCGRIASAAKLAARAGADLVADTYSDVQPIGVGNARYPSSWPRSGPEVVMTGEGTLSAAFEVRSGGVRNLWLRGELMPKTYVRIDGRRIATIEGQVSGNGDSPDSIGPMKVSLSAGRHVVSIEPAGFSLAPGNGSRAYIDRFFLAPVHEAQHLLSVPASRWRTLCGRPLEWLEVVRGAR